MGQESNKQDQGNIILWHKNEMCQESYDSYTYAKNCYNKDGQLAKYELKSAITTMSIKWHKKLWAMSKVTVIKPQLV